MTIINLTITPSKAVLIADTVPINTAGEPDGVCSKFAVVPRLNVVVAVRGQCFYLAKWAKWFDESETLEEAIAGAEHCARELVTHFKAENPDGIDGEFISLAWHNGRALGFLNLRDHDYRTIRLCDGTHAFPWIPGYPTFDEVDLLAVARQQFEHAEHLNVSPDAGGEWCQAVVSADGVSTRILGRVGNYVQ